MKEPRTPFYVTAYAHAGQWMLNRGVSRPRVDRFVIVTCFYTAMVLWLLRQPIALACAIRGGFVLAASEQLHPRSTSGERFLFFTSFAIGYARTCCEMPAYIWRTLRDEHRAYKTRNARA